MSMGGVIPGRPNLIGISDHSLTATLDDKSDSFKLNDRVAKRAEPIC